MSKSGKDVLLADDDPEDVYIFGCALSEIDNSHRLLNAKNGGQLFSMLKQEKPHIIFLDYLFPPEDGLSCIIEIRKDSAYDCIPVVLHSTAISAKLADECIQKGANSFLQKSTTYTGVIEGIQSMLDLHCK